MNAHSGGRHLSWSLVSLLVGIVCLWAALAPAAPSPSGAAVSVRPEQPRLSLAPHVEIYEDESRTATFEEIQQRDFASPTEPKRRWAHLGRTDAVVWLRFRLVNDTEQPVKLTLQPATAFVDRIDLYLPGLGHIDQSGDRLPLRARANGSVVPSFSLELPPKVDRLHYLRIDTSGNLLLPLIVQEPKAFAAGSENYLRWLGATLGMLWVTAGFFLLTFFTSRRPAHGLYSLHVVTCIAFIAVVTGLLQLVFPVWHAYWTFAFVLATDLTGLLFLREFLGTRERLPRLDRFLVASGVAIALCILHILISGERFAHGTFVYQLVSAIALFQAGTAVFEGLKGPRSRKLYAFTWVVYFVSRFAASLAMAGHGEGVGIDPVRMMMATYAFEAVLTGLSLVARVREDQLALARSERRLADLIRESPDGIVLFQSGKCVAVNPAAEAILGHPRAALEGRELGELGFVEEDDRRMGAAFARALEGSVSAAAECTLVTPDGARHHTDANFRRFSEQGDEPLVQMTLRDVTERLHTRKEQRLAEERAQQSQRLEAVGRLAGGVAHDFNNILTVILGNAELMLIRSKAPEAEHIIRAADTARGLTKQLLTFAKADSAITGVVDLNQVLEDTRQLLETLVSEKIELEMQLASVTLPVRGDTARLQQVLINLCVNSRDAMPEGGTVTVRTELLSKPRSRGDSPGDHWVRLTVADTGEGMDEATRQRIFEPFFTTKAKGRGTGLGLATVFGITRAAGGEIHVHSRRREGTRVEIDFPLASEPASARTTTNPSASASVTATLLLVEDQPDVLRVTKRVLENAGHRVLAAESSDQALDIARECGEPIDAIITDVVMPGLDGPALVKRLVQSLGPLPVLYLSGYTPDELGHDLTIGVNCLQKPVRAGELLRHVEKLIGSRQGQRRRLA